MKKLSHLKLLKTISLFMGLCLFTGCGVKGDPVPPGTPAELGRGKPSYRRATEPLAFPVVPPPRVESEEEDKEKENE